MKNLRRNPASICALMLTLVAVVYVDAGAAQDFDYETFTEQDFDKFFGLIEDGKVTADKLNAMCDGRPLGFTVEAKDAVYDGARINFNVSQQLGSVDGRSFRSRYHNASLGEWTGSVFKPLCPGLYVITLDILVGQSPPSEINAQIVLRRPGDQTPGLVMTAAQITDGTRRTGHGAVTLALGTGDEVSALLASPMGTGELVIGQAALTVAKIAHLGDLIKDFDQDDWDADLKALQ